MQVEFSVWGTDSSDIRIRAHAMLDEFCTGDDHVESFTIAVRPTLKTGIGEVCMWEGDVVAQISDKRDDGFR